MSLDAWAKSQPNRCSYGYAPEQHPGACECSESEWSVFVAAVRQAASLDGTVRQAKVRPLIRGKIPPRHIGTLYRRAKAEGLIRDTGEREPSNDFAGRNGDKLDRIYALAGAA